MNVQKIKKWAREARFLLFIGIGCITITWSRTAMAATITALSCNNTTSQLDVQNAIGQASAGDTVMLPPGTCTWSTTVALNVAGVTLMGAGQSSTIIQDQVSGALMNINIPAGSLIRMSGMTIQPLPGEVASANNRIIYITGTCTASGCSQVRLDHLLFTGWIYTSWGAAGNNFNGFMMTASDVVGVFDHLTVLATTFGEFVDIGFSSYLGVGAYGDNSWAQPDTYGTGNVLYIEDSTFTESGNTNFALTDTDDAPYGGARFVVRHNMMTNFFPGSHGTETTGRTRGGRQYEVYNNTFSCTSTNGCNTGFEMRSGTALFFNNSVGTASSAWFNSALKLSVYRTFANLGGWGWCDGTGPWDQNDGVVYDQGTIASATPTTGSSSSITDTSKNWAANQWLQNGAPYSLVDTTQGFGYEISGNTGNTISVSNSAQDYWNGPPTWNVGDSYQILRSQVCVDQTGHGQGILLSGTTPSPTGWVQEVLDPVYEWGDVFTGGHMYFGWAGGDTGKIIANRDYYTQASPFTGAAGTGSGLLANRPSTCTPMVAYWATDANTLYQCSAPNTWTAFYTPYTYPHPLQGSGTPPPPPPPTTSPCDINGDGVTNVADVQREVNMALGGSACTNPSGSCTVVSVQRVVNAALGGTCVAP